MRWAVSSWRPAARSSATGSSQARQLVLKLPEAVFGMVLPPDSKNSRTPSSSHESMDSERVTSSA